MKNIKCIIMLNALLILGCSSTDPIQVNYSNLKNDIILPEKIERVQLKKYKIETYYFDKSLNCFDKKNSDIFNENYFKMWNYIKELERHNQYLREEIKRNNNVE